MNTSAKKTCIAIDMGASNIRIMLGHISSTNLEFKEIYRFPNAVIDKNGHERWDMEHILKEIIKGIKMATELQEDIGSIGVDAWGVDYALLDKNGNLLELPVAYRDKRTDGMEETWLKMMSREETFKLSGINFYKFNTLFQLLSLTVVRQEDHSDSSGAPIILNDQTKSDTSVGSGFPASKLLFLPSFILYELCGMGINELTISSTSQMLNTGTGDWDGKILETLGISSSLMGEICAPGTILGKILHPELNMPDTEAIAVCGHDTASAVVSVPFENESSVFISTGTWCIVGIESDRPILTGEALKNGFTNERGFGGTFRSLKNIVGLWLVQGLIQSLPVKEDYNEIETLALGYEKPVNIINPEDPLFYNPDNMKNAFDEYFRKTGQKIPSDPGAYFRSAYDSLIYSFRYYIELIERMTGKEINTIHLIGGGCKSEYLTRQTALICGRRVISGPVEAATIGNILVQGIAMGIIPDILSARDLVRNTMSVATIDPPGIASQQDSHFKRFLKISQG
ncbi:MAG TPA: rhamnulokinase [Bacteroides sp.]|nr:rhamnulokinase [Bacteroides sp.]